MNENLNSSPTSTNHNQKRRDELTNILSNVDEFREFARTNPKTMTLSNGMELERITEQEWLSTASKANQPDASLMEKQGMMSGWKVAGTNQHILKKVSKEMPYELPDTLSKPPSQMELMLQNFIADQKAISPDKTPEPTGEETALPFNSKAFLKFSDIIGKMESGNKYDVVGGYNDHYQGRFQLGKAALKDAGIGFSAEERKAFLSNPDAQDDAFEAFTLQNHNYLNAKSQKYRDMNQRDKLSILGYAHNQGRGGALRYLQTGDSQADGFGTDALKYVDAVVKALRSG